MELLWTVFAKWKLLLSLATLCKPVSIPLGSQSDLVLINNRWATVYKHGDCSVQKTVLDYAQTKLCLDNTVNETVSFAALSIRVMLEFDSAREALQEVKECQVESYLCVIFTVPTHCKFMHTSTPSEPVLAEVLGLLLNPKGTNALQQTRPHVIARALNKGYLAHGEQGKLIGRLLWTLVQDVVANAMHKADETKGVLCYHCPICIIDWLKALFNHQWHKTILNLRPVGNLDGPTLAEAFGDAWLHFSHFVKAADNITYSHLWPLLIRGMAYQCRDNQVSTDLASAIHFGHNAPISHENTSSVLADLKNRMKAEPMFINPHIAGKPLNSLLVLSLLMELGVLYPCVDSHKNVKAETWSGVEGIHH
jgi:hypothetical protein